MEDIYRASVEQMEKEVARVQQEGAVVPLPDSELVTITPEKDVSEPRAEPATSQEAAVRVGQMRRRARLSRRREEEENVRRALEEESRVLRRERDNLLREFRLTLNDPSIRDIGDIRAYYDVADSDTSLSDADYPELEMTVPPDMRRELGVPMIAPRRAPQPRSTDDPFPLQSAVYGNRQAPRVFQGRALEVIYRMMQNEEISLNQLLTVNDWRTDARIYSLCVSRYLETHGRAEEGRYWSYVAALLNATHGTFFHTGRRLFCDGTINRQDYGSNFQEMMTEMRVEIGRLMWSQRLV